MLRPYFLHEAYCSKCKKVIRIRLFRREFKGKCPFCKATTLALEVTGRGMTAETNEKAERIAPPILTTGFQVGAILPERLVPEPEPDYDKD